MKPETTKWSALFLDRDGVINENIPGDYVRNPDQLVFCLGAVEAIAWLSTVFPRIVVVTNQQGINKGLFTEQDLHKVHQKMLKEIESFGGRIDAIYFCPHLVSENCLCRKPGTGMPLEAKARFPEIEFPRSIMVGDYPTDIEMGKNLGMTTVIIGDLPVEKCDFRFASLSDFCQHFQKHLV